MDYETVKACMNQKIVLLKKIRELSREIELHCCESNLDPTKLPNQRQVYLDRLKKCESLLSAQVERQTPADRERLQKVLSAGGKGSVQGEEERALYETGVTFRAMLREILATDAISIRRMKEKRDRYQELLHRQSRASKPGKLSFYAGH